MQTLSQVTTRNNQTTDYKLKCNASGLYFCDATKHFEVISITCSKDRALTFPDLAAAELAQKLVTSLYGSFDWQPVAA